MLDYFNTEIQPSLDKLNELLAEQIHQDLLFIQRSAKPTDEELGF